LIKINLVREGRAVRGAGAAPTAAAVAGGGGTGAANINNVLIIACLVLGLIASAAYWYFYKRELQQQEEIAEQRQGEAQKLESIIKEVDDFQKRKDSLQQRIDLINQLKQNQKGPVRIMDQISRDLPDLVWLDSLEINAGRITLNGRGLNPNAIALFIEKIKNDQFFEEPQVGQLSQISSAPVVYSFDMNFAFTYTPKNAAGTAGAATDTNSTATAAATQ
jgi:type IV pilus assembly protein PilN